MKARRNCAKPLIASALFSTLLASLPGIAADTPATPPAAAEESRLRDALFERLDTNRDGYVTRAEAARQSRFMDAFRQADEDRDDKLTRGEFVKAHAIYDRERLASYTKDGLITAKIKAALVKDPLVSALKVSVETADGKVLLSGFVDSESQVRRAREIAAGIDGVKQVYVNLVVSG